MSPSGSSFGTTLSIIPGQLSAILGFFVSPFLILLAFLYNLLFILVEIIGDNDYFLRLPFVLHSSYLTFGY